MRRTNYLLLEFRNKEVYKSIVKVFSTKEGITVSRFHFKYSLLNFQDGYIKSTSTKVINSNSTEQEQGTYRQNVHIEQTKLSQSLG